MFMDEKAWLAEKVLSSIEVPGFDVDIVSSGLVTGFRISSDERKIAVYVDFTGSQPSCLFCKFINNTLWNKIIGKMRERLMEAGFEEVLIVDERFGNRFHSTPG
jgi:metal-sulfur cluster biosynthetic enzyme